MAQAACLRHPPVQFGSLARPHGWVGMLDSVQCLSSPGFSSYAAGGPRLPRRRLAPRVVVVVVFRHPYGTLLPYGLAPRTVRTLLVVRRARPSTCNRTPPQPFGDRSRMPTHAGSRFGRRYRVADRSAVVGFPDDEVDRDGAFCVLMLRSRPWTRGAIPSGGSAGRRSS